MLEEVRLQELIAQKDARIRQLEADNERQSQGIKLLKEKVDLLIRRLFGAKSEKRDVAQLELLLKEVDLGKADASAEKVEGVEAAPITGLLKPVPKSKRKTGRWERWPQDLPIEREIIPSNRSKEARNTSPVSVGETSCVIGDQGGLLARTASHCCPLLSHRIETHFRL